MAKQPHSYNSGRINRASGNGGRAAQPPQGSQPPPRQAQSAPRPQNAQQPQRAQQPYRAAQKPHVNDEDYLPPVKAKQKRKKWPVVVIALSIIIALLGTGVFFVLRYLDDVFEPGEFGIITPFKELLEDETIKPYSKKELLHFLILGIDYEEGRYSGDGLGLTDMIMYCRYDIKNNQLNMIQIPRDSFVGDDVPTGGSGKINALLISGEDKQHPINNLTTAFQQKFKLPVDHYVAVDMEGMRAIVDHLGPLRVYVPQDMDYDGGHLSQGWQWLDGAASEFFVRTRHGAGFARGDVDRLDNQRHFYSALFRRFLNLTPADVPKLLNVFHYYCNTDLPLNDLFGLGVAALNLKSENVMFCKAPGATGTKEDVLDPAGQGRWTLYVLDLYGRGTPEEPGLANLLNQYFRDPEYPVPPEELGLPQYKIPDRFALYPPNVQGMAEVQEPEGGGDVNVEPEHLQ